MLNVSTELFPPSYEVVNSHAAKHNKHTVMSSTYDMYKSLPEDILHKLFKLYGPDYDIFLYPIPSWLKR